MPDTPFSVPVTVDTNELSALINGLISGNMLRFGKIFVNLALISIGYICQNDHFSALNSTFVTLYAFVVNFRKS